MVFIDGFRGRDARERGRIVHRVDVNRRRTAAGTGSVGGCFSASVSERCDGENPIAIAGIVCVRVQVPGVLEESTQIADGQVVSQAEIDRGNPTRIGETPAPNKGPIGFCVACFWHVTVTTACGPQRDSDAIDDDLFGTAIEQSTDVQRKCSESLGSWI